MNAYKIPAHLRGLISKDFPRDTRRRPNTAEHQASLAFEAHLTGLGLKVKTGRDHGLTALRLPAAQAGLGLIRRNNFFYSESGSSVWLEGRLIDRELEWLGAPALKPCPEKCGKCLQACPTQALSGPFSMDPLNCVSFPTWSPEVDLTAHPSADLMGAGFSAATPARTPAPLTASPSLRRTSSPAWPNWPASFPWPGLWRETMIVFG